MFTVSCFSSSLAVTMRVAMNIKLSMAIMAHYATRAISTEHIQFVQSSELRKFSRPSISRCPRSQLTILPADPKLTTVLSDGIQRPVATGGAQGTMSKF